MSLLTFAGFGFRAAGSGLITQKGFCRTYRKNRTFFAAYRYCDRADRHLNAPVWVK